MLRAKVRQIRSYHDCNSERVNALSDLEPLNSAHVTDGFRMSIASSSSSSHDDVTTVWANFILPEIGLTVWQRKICQDFQLDKSPYFIIPSSMNSEAARIFLWVETLEKWCLKILVVSYIKTRLSLKNRLDAIKKDDFKGGDEICQIGQIGSDFFLRVFDWLTLNEICRKNRFVGPPKVWRS